MFIFRKKLVLILAVLLIAGVYFYFHLGFYFGQTVRDSDNNFKKLSEMFMSQVNPQVDQKYLDSYNIYSYQHRDGSWEIVQPGARVPWYANFIDTEGSRRDKFLTYQTIWTGVDSMYFRKPYLFLTSHPGFLHIYNTETYQLRTLDVRSNGCHDDSAYLTGVAYDEGVLYTEQFKEWSWCTGNFKRKFNLDF